MVKLMLIEVTKMFFRIFNKWLCAICILLINKVTLASTFTITPLDIAALPTSILNGHTAKAYYTIRNNTSIHQKNIHIQLPPNVKQVVNNGLFLYTCGTSFELAEKGISNPINYGDSVDFCLLELTVSGAVDSSDLNPTHHLAVCQANDCSTVEKKENELNIIEGKPNNLTRVAIVTEPMDKSYVQRTMAYISTDNGMDWKPNIIDGVKGVLNAANCDADNGQSCIAVGKYGEKTDTVLAAYYSGDGGVTWSHQIIDRYNLNYADLSGVTCNRETGEYCVAVGSYHYPPKTNQLAPIIYTKAGRGTNWIPHYPKQYGPWGPHIRNVSCGGNNAQYCTAVGDFFATTSSETTFVSYSSTDGGKNWRDSVMGTQKGSGQVNAISCVNNNQLCMAVGTLNANTYSGISKAIIFISTDGGSSWGSYNPEPSHYTTLNSVTCNQDNMLNCVAVGSVTSAPFIYSRGTWIRLSGGSLKSVTCSNQGKYCTAIGYDAKKFTPITYTSVNGGETWNRRAFGFVNKSELVRKIVNSSGIIVTGANE